MAKGGSTGTELAHRLAWGGVSRQGRRGKGLGDEALALLKQRLQPGTPYLTAPLLLTTKLEARRRQAAPRLLESLHALTARTEP